MNMERHEAVEQVKIETPLVQMYVGDGKGKTTAAMGLALRAVGHGFHVKVVQFLKGSVYSGENISAMQLDPLLEIKHFGRECPNTISIAMGWTKCSGCGACFVKKGEVTEEDRDMAKAACDQVREYYEDGMTDMIVLDEISNAIYFDALSIDAAVELVNARPKNIELILTGRNMPEELMNLADLITEMKVIKHPFQRGILGRRGVEY